MAVFEYVGKSAGGKTVKGVMDVDNVRALKAALRRDKVFLTEYKQTNAKGKELLTQELKNFDFGMTFGYSKAF